MISNALDALEVASEAQISVQSGAKPKRGLIFLRNQSNNQGKEVSMRRFSIIIAVLAMPLPGAAGAGRTYT